MDQDSSLLRKRPDMSNRVDEFDLEKLQLEKEREREIKGNLKKEKKKLQKYGLVPENRKEKLSMMKSSSNKRKMISVGLTDKMIHELKDPKYIIDIKRLPIMTFSFFDLDYNKALKEN